MSPQEFILKHVASMLEKDGYTQEQVSVASQHAVKVYNERSEFKDVMNDCYLEAKFFAGGMMDD